MPNLTSSLRSLQPTMTVEEALHIIKGVADHLEEARADLAQLYVAAPGGSTMEHEIGEVLTTVRKANVRIRKAVGELAQAELPFDDDDGR